MFPPFGPSSDYEYPRGPLKRYHDDGTQAQSDAEEVLTGDASYSSEHRNKRQHTLPFRTSPTQQRWTPQPPSAMTPPGSFSETAKPIDAQGSSGFGCYSQTSTVVENGAMMADMDMDMSPDGEPSQANLMPPDHDFSDRMPTPMQPTFAAQVRGNNWNGATANASYAGPDTTSANMSQTSQHYRNQGYGRSVPRSLEHPAVMGDWSMTQNRSLPSPISEDGAGGGSGNDARSPDHCHDHDDDHVHSHDYDSGFSTPHRPGTIASSPLPASSPARATTNGGDPATTPSPKKGHSRSRHTIMAWTHQPGMKKSFSIGYRADCEKCRNRVPGHFNHIVVS